MLLPRRRLRDLGQRRTLGALHHCDDLRLLVAAFALVAGLLACRLLRGLGLLCRLAALGRFRWFWLLGLACHRSLGDRLDRCPDARHRLLAVRELAYLPVSRVAVTVLLEPAHPP